MSEYLRDHMKLSANVNGAVPPSLDVMAKMVYQCAVGQQTIAETASSCGLDRDLVNKIIEQLLSAKLVKVVDPSVATPSARPSQNSVASSNRFDSVQETGKFVQRLESLYEACHHQNYYDLLGVDPDTPRAELRTRYFELSKQFHPDKAFIQEAKERKDKMAVIFQRLTLAYETLSNRNKKAAYDASIAEQLELRSLERSLSRAVAQSRAASSPPSDAPSKASVSAPPTGSISAPPGRSVPPVRPSVTSNPPLRRPSVSSTVPPNRTSQPDGVRRNTVTTPSDIKTFRPSAPPVSKADARRQQLKRRLAGRAMAELLSRRSKIPEAVSNVEKSLADAELAMDQDRYSDAANLARSILKHYPDNEKAKQLLKDAGKGLSQTQVRLHMRRSLYAKRDGQPEQAKWHLEQALVIDPNHIDARHMLAELVFGAGDVQRALSLMKEVIVLGGQRARYFVTLGEIFLAIEDLERASDAFNRALSLEPDNRDIKKRLKSCNR